MVHVSQSRHQIAIPLDKAVNEYFPYDSFRQYQKQAMVKTINALDDKYKVVIVEAPTGFGKSPFGMGVANWFGSSYILTSQKALQDQYVDDFGIPCLKGKGNYKCSIEPVTADIADCKECDEICDYKKDYYKAINSPVSILNYAIAVRNKSLKKEENIKDLLICDECHNLESILMDSVSFSISEKRLKSLEIDATKPNTDYAKELFKWVKGDLIEAVGDRLNDINFKVASTSSSQDEIKLRKKRLGVKRFYDKLSFFIDSFNDIQWVYCEKEGNFKPLKVDKFSSMIFGMGKRLLLMSATVLDASSFAKSLGFSDDEVFFLRIPSTFPKENRPIYTNYANIDLSYKKINIGLHVLRNHVKEIIDKFPNDKGIIHTTTYRIANHLEEYLGSDRFIIPRPETRDADINRFMTSDKPLILVSPSLTEGLDLKDDLSRFQILCKIPYPFLGDKQIKERKNIDPSWYMWKTCLNIVQAYGRSIRSKTDYAKTYVLDGTFNQFVSRNKNRLPQWFTEAITSE